MLKQSIFFLVFLSSILADPSLPRKSSTGPVPDWVKKCELSTPTSSKEHNLKRLLYDTQTHWEEKTTYIHRAVQALSPHGAEKISQFRVVFDPSYQKVVVHSLGIYRDGKYLDRMNSRSEEIQQEPDLDILYEGRLTLVYFLEDVRPGDTVESSFSCTENHPIFASHFAEEIELQKRHSAERIYHRILMHPDQKLYMKYFNGATKPIMTDLSPTLREYSWEIEKATPAKDDYDSPLWFDPRSYVHVSQYESWAELALLLVPYYVVPDDLIKNPSQEMVQLTEGWKEKSADPKERALLALRFVQDEIRYLGFEEGIGGHKPRDPRGIFQHRYGDCKDKTVLLQALLYLMEIPSTPLLVHAPEGKKVIHFLPDPGAFNHVVLKIQIDDNDYFVDPTISFQGGTLDTLYFPSYDWGLSLTRSQPDLIPLPEHVLKQPGEHDISISVTSPTSANLALKATLNGIEADMLRNGFSILGIEKLSEIVLQGIQSDYKGAKVLQPLTVKDDRLNNTLLFEAAFQIPTRNRGGKRILKVGSSIQDDFDLDIKLERHSPFSIAHPDWQKEHIHVENRFHDWTPEKENVKIRHDAFSYEFAMERTAHTVDFDLEYKSLKDHVPARKIQEYFDVISEIESNHLFELLISDPKSKKD